MVELSSRGSWPDGYDTLATIIFLAAIIVLPAIGYALVFLDFRAYLRSLRGALVRVVRSIHDLPDWARSQTPPCLAALGLELPCTEEDLKRAYRDKVKDLHPDRGGDKRRFLILQAHFEEGMRLLAGTHGRKPSPTAGTRDSGARSS